METIIYYNHVKYLTKIVDIDMKELIDNKENNRYGKENNTINRA